VLSTGVAAVLLKGGHLGSDAAVDLLLNREGRAELFLQRRLGDGDVRGTGCALASLIAAFLAQGMDLFDAASRSRDMLQKAIQTAITIGDGPPLLGRFP
jgi:hydroxymethylpyrimidine/phosphomethylpyrimidine kinase